MQDAETVDEKEAALGYIKGLYWPYHGLINGWKEWFYNGNAKGSAPYELGPR